MAEEGGAPENPAWHPWSGLDSSVRIGVDCLLENEELVWLRIVRLVRH